MSKKVISLCLVLCMAFTLMIPGYAQAKEKISSNTTITEDNIYEVLDYLGIDSSNFEKSDNVSSGATTVGELEKLIEKEKNAPKEPIQSEGSKSSDNLSIMAMDGSKTLYHENDYSTYSLMYSCTGYYTIGVPGWTSCGGGSVTGDGAVGYTVKLVNYPYISTFLSSDKTKVNLSYNVTAKIYLGVNDFGLILLNTVNHTGTINWLSSDFIGA